MNIRLFIWFTWISMLGVFVFFGTPFAMLIFLIYAILSIIYFYKYLHPKSDEEFEELLDIIGE